MANKYKDLDPKQIAHELRIALLVETFFFGAITFPNFLVRVAEIEDTRAVLGSFHLLHYCVVGPPSGLPFTLSHQPKVQTFTEPGKTRYAGPLRDHVYYLCSPLGTFPSSR